MAELLANGHAVLAGTIRLPRVGRWSADLVVDTGEPLAGAVTVERADGALALRGTAHLGGAFAERGHVLVLGGAGGLERQLPPRFYRGAPARLPLGDLLREAGEALSARSDAATLDRVLPFWTRTAGTAAAALERLCAALGASWRTLADGTVWVGPETWPAVDLDADVMDEDPADDRAVYAFDELPPALLPGATLGGRRVSVVEHAVADRRLRTTVLFEQPGAVDDRASGDLEAFVRGATRHLVDHYAAYRARVVGQNADGTLELVPDAPHLPSMSGVPVRAFAPGVALKVPAGSYALLEFEAGDPSKPYAALWEAAIANLTELRIGAGATKGAARQDDATSNGSLVFSATGNTLTITYTPPGGAPQVTTVTFAASGGVVVAVPSGGSAALAGKISAASGKTFIE